MMNERQIEDKLKLAFEHAAPDVLENINSRLEEQKGQVIIMSDNMKKNRFGKMAAIAAAAVLFLGLGLGGAHTYRTNYAVAATVALEVNPSIEITVNQKERVLEVTPLNEDGRVIIGEMDFSGSNLDVTVNALIGSMLKNGYLNEMSNSILISVDDKNAYKGEALQQKLTKEVDMLLNEQAFAGAVLSQTLSDDEKLRQLAAENDISLGKAQLIQQILAEHPEKSFGSLAKLSINELNLILANDTPKLEKIASVGTASTKAYIGEEQAKAIALKHAGADAGKISKYEWELDGDDGIMVYEVEFTANGYEYEYEINAVSGAIIKSEKKQDGRHTGTISSSASGNAPAAYITAEQAQTAALKHAGLTVEAIGKYECKLDRDDRIAHYEIEFQAGGYEYEYEINAANGAVIKCEKEADSVHEHNDHDDHDKD